MQHYYYYLNSYIPKCPIEISHSFQKVNSLNASICQNGFEAPLKR